MTVEANDFDGKWAVVELMGHVTLAGRVYADSTLSVNMLRLDVPQIGDIAAYTKLIGPHSIYSITFVSEDVALRAAEYQSRRPIHEYQLSPASEPNRPTHELGFDRYDNEDGDEYDPDAHRYDDEDDDSPMSFEDMMDNHPGTPDPDVIHSNEGDVDDDEPDGELP